MARLDYANARLAARRPGLAGAPELRALLARATLEARLELLRAWPIGASLPPALGQDPLGEVEAALREGWRRDAAAVLADVEGRRQRSLLQAFLSLDEADAVKAVLRCVARAASPDRAVAAAPPGPAPRDAGLRDAAAATTLDGALDGLAAGGSSLAAPIREALAAGGGGLLPLEIAADRAALARARAACRGRGEDAAILRAHLEDRVDARNAATLLALGGATPAEDPFVPGGRRLDEGALRALAGLAPGALRAALAPAFPELAGASASPGSADRALERAVLAPLRREARRRPLSLAVPLAYLAERRAEIRRVALVLRGAALELDGGEILDLAEA